MSNKIVGYMLAVPTLLFLFLFIFLRLMYPQFLMEIMRLTDIPIYLSLLFLIVLGLFVSLFKLWKLPNPEKKSAPISNRGLMLWIVIMIAFITTIDAAPQFGDIGKLIYILYYIIILVLISIVSYRLITSNSNTQRDGLPL